MEKRALIIGNSDGMGLELTRRLLDRGWEVTGISRSPSPVDLPEYSHHVQDVGDPGYPILLKRLCSGEAFDLCGYFAGIGEELDPLDIDREAEIIDVNLTGMVRTAAAVIPPMIRRGEGHFLGISSLGDELVSAEAPSYFASKAGFSNYLAGLARALKPKGIHVTNVRFGFVDTKMAQGAVKPLMLSVDKAVDKLEHCLRKKPKKYTTPKTMIPLIKISKWLMKLTGK